MNVKAKVEQSEKQGHEIGSEDSRLDVAANSNMARVRSIVPYAELLNPPIKRSAYSDRTAWIMATMAELAYIRFEAAKSIEATAAEALRLITGTNDPQQQQKTKTLGAVLDN